MLIDVPFNNNPDNWHCIHAAMKSVIEHFSKEFYSIEYLNALMNPDRDLWVWPSQVVKALDEVGLFTRLFTNSLNSWTSMNGIYAAKTDDESLIESINYLKEKTLLENRNLSIAELEKFLVKGCLPLIILGAKKQLGKYALITGFDAKNFYYHDTGPHHFKPNKQISKERFIELWSRSPSLNSAIIVFGKKYKDTYTRFNF